MIDLAALRQAAYSFETKISFYRGYASAIS